jgi:iron complex outermembrane receptor protein
VSFSQKYTGPQYATEYSTTSGGATTVFALGNQRLYRIKPYSYGEFAISQDIGKQLRLGLTISNVFNNRAVTALSNSSSGAPTTTSGGVTYQTGYGQLDQFAYLPPRSLLVDARIRF